MAFLNGKTRLTQLQKAKEGVGKHFQSVTAITLGGVTLTPTELMAKLQSELDAMAATSQLNAALKTQRDAERSTHREVAPLSRALKAYVLAMYGDTDKASAILEDFGYKPRKSAKRTLEAKVEAKAKNLATRKARNTVGPKKKEAIKGNPATPPIPVKQV